MARSKNKPREANTTHLLPVPTRMPSTREMVAQIGGPQRASKVLRVSLDLLEAWTSERIETPWTVKLAMFWQSEHGFAAAFSSSHWTHEYNSFLKNEARARVELLERYIVARGWTPPEGRLTSHGEMLLAGPRLHDTDTYAIREIGHAGVDREQARLIAAEIEGKQSTRPALP